MSDNNKVKTDELEISRESTPPGYPRPESPPTPSTPGTPPSPGPMEDFEYQSPDPLPRVQMIEETRKKEIDDVDKFDLSLSDDELSSEEEENDGDKKRERRQIFGTLIVVEEVMTNFRNFLLNYELNEEHSKSKYYMLLMKLQLHGTKVLNIDMRDLYNFNRELYNSTINYPQEIIGIMDEVSTKVSDDLFGDEDEDNSDSENMEDEETKLNEETVFKILVRPFNLPKTKRIRGLDTKDIDHLVCIRGMVTRVCDVLPDLKQACFCCKHCGSEIQVNISHGHIREPRNCGVCKSDKIELIHNRCLFDDKQHIKLQETPESIPEGETPRSITVIAHDMNVDILKPGDRVDCTGIYRAVERRKNFGKRSVETIVTNFVDVVHFSLAGNVMKSKNVDEKEEKEEEEEEEEEDDDDDDDMDELNKRTTRVNKMMKKSAVSKKGDDSWNYNQKEELNEELIISQKEEKQFRSLSKREDIFEILIRSLSPSIFGMEAMKKGILCQLFGGTNKDLKHMRIRGDLHILLMGDPGTSKSQLLLQAIKIASRGIYTSGKGSSSVGLTAYVQRDISTGELVLESGALVLSDQGICCIDEFDKMSEFTRSMLHEVMEQQTVSIAKAGIVCSLNARTSILASANPVDSTYNDKKSFMNNVDLPPPLLSRFDMIFLVRDNMENDEKLAEHIVKLFEEEVEGEEDDDSIILDQSQLKKYVYYARKNIAPILNEEIEEKLVSLYLRMRKIACGKGQLNSTPRQLESLIRMSESIAKMHYRKEVIEEDVERAFEIMKETVYFKTTNRKMKVRSKPKREKIKVFRNNGTVGEV